MSRTSHVKAIAGESGLMGEEARARQLRKLLAAWRETYQRMCEHRDPEAEKLRRDIERMEEALGERRSRTAETVTAAHVGKTSQSRDGATG